MTGYDAMAGILVYALSRSLRNYRSRLQEGVRFAQMTNRAINTYHPLLGDHTLSEYLSDVCVMVAACV